MWYKASLDSENPFWKKIYFFKKKLYQMNMGEVMYLKLETGDKFPV